MGSGGSKAHEAFTIAPAPPVALPGGGTVSAALADLAGDTHPVADPTVSEGAGTARPSAVDDPTSLQDIPDVDTDLAPVDDPPVVERLSGQDWVTPIPDTVAVGDMAGTPLVVGGHDLDNSSATLVAYDSPEGPRHVLYGWVNGDVDHKILAAVALDDEKLIPTQVTKNVSGRLGVDTDNGLYEQLTKVAKSVNHHLKANDGIPAHTHTNHADLVAQLADLHTDATDDEAAMLAAYQHSCDQIGLRLAHDYDTPYGQGGKIAFLTAHEVDATVTVTEMVPAPANDDVPDGMLAATIRQATRIKPTLAADGTGSWDGTARHTGQAGVEYRIDLGEGFEAIYRPHATDAKSAAAGHRGFLEVIAPPGTDNAPAQLVTRLGQINLANRPMTNAEAEWTYLTRNIWSQRLDSNPKVAAAVSQASLLDDSMTELVFAERAHQVVGMTDSQLTGFARDIRLEGEARALSAKTKMVGTAIAAAQGHDTFAGLRAQPGYDPTPRASGGWHTWSRWDVTANPDAIDYHGRVLYHRVTGNNLDAMFANSGLLAATERRRVMGIASGLGMSEGADMSSGGSRAVDLRIGHAPSKGPYMVWSNPSRLLARSDWYAYNGDHFAAYEGTKTSGQTRNPATVAAFTASNNEVLFRDGIDLTSPHEAPDRIVCSSKSQRTKVLKALKARDITHLAGIRIDKAVTT